MKRQSAEQSENGQAGGDAEGSPDSSKAPEANASTDGDSGPKEDDAAARARERLERFKALKARAVSIPTSSPSVTFSLQGLICLSGRYMSTEADVKPENRD